MKISNNICSSNICSSAIYAIYAIYALVQYYPSGKYADIIT